MTRDDIIRMEALLVAMVGETLAPKWWDSPNRAFEGKTPKEIYSANPDSVYTYLMKCAEGQW